MRFWSISVAVSSVLVSSQLVALPLHRGRNGLADSQSQPDLEPDRKQNPLAEALRTGLLDIKMSPAASTAGAVDTGSVMLSDVMGRDRSINMFAGFTRDIESVSRRLEDPFQSLVVLAPLNSAIEGLHRKPWEDARHYKELGTDAYEGDEGYERAQKNLRRFVQAHIVPRSPWGEGEKAKPIDDGRDIWWEDRNGTRVIQPDNIEVVGVAGTVANGQLWILKGVRSY